MTTLREAAQQALEALAIGQDAAHEVAQTYHEAMAGYRPARHIAVDDDVRKIEDAITALRAALAEPVVEPVAWIHNLIDDNIITHRPADIDRHPDRWTALYPEPKPCPTCEALARTVMMDQTGYDTAPPQRKPLTEEEKRALADKFLSCQPESYEVSGVFDLISAVERAHDIT